MKVIGTSLGSGREISKTKSDLSDCQEGVGVYSLYPCDAQGGYQVEI